MTGPTLYGYDVAALAHAMTEAYQAGQRDRLANAELAEKAVRGDRESARTITAREAADTRKAVEFARSFQPANVKGPQEIRDLFDLCRINGTWQGTNATIDRAVAEIDHQISFQDAMLTPDESSKRPEIPQLSDIDRDSWASIESSSGSADARGEWPAWQEADNKLHGFRVDELERAAATATAAPPAADQTRRPSMSADFPVSARGAVQHRPAPSPAAADRPPAPPPESRHTIPGL